MARTITAGLLTVWLGLGLFIREPHWVFLPLWGLFPGDCSFHGSVSHLAALLAWVFSFGVALVALVYLAFRRNSNLAAGIFAIVLLLSGYLGVWRSI